MPFPLPTLDELTRRQEGLMEAAIRRARPDADPAAIARAVRSETGMFAVIARTNAQALLANHLHLRWWGDQYLPDTAEAEFLIRHANIWGVFRRAAIRATGLATFSGQVGLAVPAGLQMTNANGAVIETLGPGVIGSGGAAVISVRAVAAGTAGNAQPLAVLPLVAPLPGLEPQAAVADAGGLQGGADTEDDAGLLARILRRIQQPPHGGANFDYDTWLRNAFQVAKVAVVPGWVGRGSVGVIVAMDTAEAPRVANPAEIDAMLALLGPLNSPSGLRPVTAEVVVVAHIPKLLAFTLAVQPDTAAIRGAIAAALTSFIAREAEIGQPLSASRLSEAISSASGEFRHRITSPAGDVASAPRELAQLGAITWEPY